ncbi:MAG: hypothetical protein GY795_11420 [Desulfobacterales bacterium]|nr:hypothetical protein [Desulfobacterales bacterium]
MPPLSHEHVVIPAASAFSGIVDARSQFVVGIITPAAWTDADIAFEGYVADDSTGEAPVAADLVPVREQAGALVTIAGIPTAESAYITFVGSLATKVAALMYFRLRSADTADDESDAAQAEERDLILILQPRSY